MTSRLLPGLLALVVATSPAIAQEGEVVAADELAIDSASSPILARVPSSLPRSEPGRWAQFFEEVASEQIARRIGPEVIGRLARAEAAYKIGDYPSALESLYLILEEEPDLPPALLVLGTTYFRLRRYGDTITCIERFLEVAPSELWRTQVLAHSYYSLGRYERAREHYHAVLSRSPESPEAIRGLALSEMRLGRFERALELLDQVVALEPASWEAHATKAQILWESGELEAALAPAERARDLVPHQPRPWFLLKNLYWELERDDEADAAEARWRELDALTQEIRSVRGKLLFEPGDFGLSRRLAELCARAGDVEGAREALDRVVRNIPADVRRVDVYVYALDLLWDLGDHEGAASAASALERDCADEPAAWRRLEYYHAVTGDRRRQIESGERYRRMLSSDG